VVRLDGRTLGAGYTLIEAPCGLARWCAGLCRRGRLLDRGWLCGGRGGACMTCSGFVVGAAAAVATCGAIDCWSAADSRSGPCCTDRVFDLRLAGGFAKVAYDPCHTETQAIGR
jgi:hypothetical protein